MSVGPLSRLFIHSISSPTKNNCGTPADIYVEHDALTLLIDLILLKRGVYRHLLYNRGAEPRRSVSGATVDSAASRKTATEKEQVVSYPFECPLQKKPLSFDLIQL